MHKLGNVQGTPYMSKFWRTGHKMENKYYISFHRNTTDSQKGIGCILIKTDCMCRYLGMFGNEQAAKWLSRIGYRAGGKVERGEGVSFYNQYNLYLIGTSGMTNQNQKFKLTHF